MDYIDQQSKKATMAAFTGPGLWTIIHQSGMAADSNPENIEFFHNIVKFVCDNYKSVDCRNNFYEFYNSAIPNKYFFAWTVDAHNAVNRRQGKRILTLDEAYKIWSPDNIRIEPCNGQEKVEIEEPPFPFFLKLPVKQLTRNMWNGY